ncbi:MAG TPA: SMP-30/gluconolactonase/LRE family protein [Acidimicrobiales bacterium]|jgi:sugar lactone lactonase YvrE|nr:SMP-30/gluconolactonase/LRE family protein [Acidimicrobiales bacterium]
MAARTFETLAEGGGFFEGPRWHDGRWWVSDFYRHTVFAIAPDGTHEEVLTVEGQPSGLGWMPDGSLLVVSMKDRQVLRRSPDGTMSAHADISEHCGGHANDMVVDTSGHAYVGNFGFDLMAGETPCTTALVRVTPGGAVAVAADDLAFPNGMVITPDGSTLIVGESFGARYTAFTIGDDGSLRDRRVWAAVDGVGPDGCALDAEGHIWAADALGRRLVRVAEGKGVVDEIPGPEGLGVFACMLGGEDGRTLLVCAAPDFLERNRSQASEAVLLTTRVDVPHAGLP